MPNVFMYTFSEKDSNAKSRDIIKQTNKPSKAELGVTALHLLRLHLLHRRRRRLRTECSREVRDPQPPPLTQY
jgi:hypothetical protein